MRMFTYFTVLLALTGCVSYQPVKLVEFTYNPAGPTDVKDARAYALKAAQSYKQHILENYSGNNKYDSWILNFVALGAAAEIGNMHSDVFKTLALGLGYQTARKTYQDIPHQLETYTNAMRAAQCVFNQSARLPEASTLIGNLNDIKADIGKAIYLLELGGKDTNDYVAQAFPDPESYQKFKTSLNEALTLATQAHDKFELAGEHILITIQEIDNNAIQRFNGKLPDISAISQKLQNIAASNMQLENSKLPPQNADTSAAQSLRAAAADGSTAAVLQSALLAVHELSSLDVNRYLTDLNNISSCSTQV
ncbi:hypothetical protein [Alteromonas sp. a30]|uniref:hypothetical protein n=1 Tax=Alteromonas sp. a30 TaxID=2730917 RepID=UPI00228239BD|nr:hypothetical protein [Alteromonas sp. a30]MCY7297239.1 hypothetical protein [Alteromonas sp. a30]